MNSTMNDVTSRERPLLTVHGITKSYGEKVVLGGVDLAVSTGEVLCIIGPSGGGKSTLLRCINHLEPPTGGRVQLDGELIGYEKKSDRLVELKPRQLARQRRSIGMVFQHFNLFANRTALENIVEGPIRVLHDKPDAAIAIAHRLLAQVGLADQAHLYPSQLSGGQQQRVAIARTLAMRPKLIMFDEPTSALDPELVGEVLATMRTLAADGMTMVVVTHEIGFARSVGTHVALMADGRIVEEGTPDRVLNNPQHQRTQRFLKDLL
jgi:polar amino acid transport system ATP-binding protein